MNREEILDTLKTGLAQLFKDKKDLNLDHINESTRLIEDLKLDSISLIMMSLEIEKSFNIDISDLTIKNFSTVGNVIDYIGGKLHA